MRPRTNRSTFGIGILLPVVVVMLASIGSASGSPIPVLPQSSRVAADRVIVKVRVGYLPAPASRRRSIDDSADRVRRWAADAGAATASVLWSAPSVSAKAAAVDENPGRRTFVLTPTVGTTPEELVHRLEQRPWVEYAEVDRRFELHQLPDDSLFSRQWPLTNTGQAYLSVTGIPGPNNDTLAERTGTPGADIKYLSVYAHPGPRTRVLVCIIDTGIDTDHEDLAGHVFVNPGEIPGNGVDDDHNGFIDDVYGWDFSGDDPNTPNNIIQDNDISDSIGHGTHVAGTVAAVADNGIGIAGVADSARVFGAKIFPNAFFSVSAQALYYAVARGARVINMSWGGGFPSNALHDALRFAHARGVVLVASMGNSGRDEILYPSGYEETIGVGASTATDHLATFSTYNDYVDVIAPGRDVLSLRAAGTDLYAAADEPDVHIVDERYYIASGTSMAAPHVTGAAAALLSIAPGLSNERVREILRTTADDVIDPYGDGATLPGHDRLTGWGRINLAGAVAALPGVFVAIDQPRPGEWIDGTINITGYASGDAFTGFSLKVAPGHQPEPSDWTTVASSNIPVDGGLLAQWNTAGLNGPYTIRLDGGTDARIDIRVNLVQAATADIISPAPGDSARLAVTIMGTAAAPEFARYHLDAAGPIPATTVHAIGEFSRPIWGDTLGIWELGQLATGDYWLRLAVESDSGEVRDSVQVRVVDIFHDGWPVTLPAHAHFAVTAVDLDGYVDPADGHLTKEIVCPTNRGLWVLSADRRHSDPRYWPSYPGWPRDTLVYYRTPPAFADLDNDGKYEIIIATPDSMHVYAWIGEEYAGWPQPFDGESHLYGVSLPTVGDIDNDGRLEIAAIDRGGRIQVWRENGDLYVPQSSPFGAIPITNSSFNALPQARICDLDRDGQSELIAIGDEIHVFNGRTGEPYRGLSTSLIASHHSINGVVIGDFDNDLRRDIALLGTDGLGQNFFVSIVGVVTMERDNGQVFDTLITLPGWPRVIPPTVDKFLVYSMSAGDIDGDGIPELFVAPYSLGEGLLYAFRANGDPVATGSSDGLFMRLSGSASSVGIIDIDGDSEPEIVFRVGELLYGPDRIYALEPDGSFVAGYPIVFGTGSSTTLSTPIVGDVDGDGFADMVTVQSTGTSVALWNLSTPAGMRGSPWPRFQADLWNTGVALTPLYDAVYMYRMIDYVLLGGAGFPPYEPTDLNCDHATDVVDIAYMIDYLFAGGSPPCVP